MVNDISIAAIVISILLLVGFIMPSVQSALSYPQDVPTDTDELGNIIDENSASGDIGIFTGVLRTLIYIAPFGMFWLDIPLLILKIILLFIVARNIYPLGSGA